jgi:hypothetical protein
MQSRGHSLQILWLGASAGTTPVNLDNQCTEACFQPLGLPSDGRLPAPQEDVPEKLCLKIRVEPTIDPVVIVSRPHS